MSDMWYTIVYNERKLIWLISRAFPSSLTPFIKYNFGDTIEYVEDQGEMTEFTQNNIYDSIKSLIRE